MNNAVADQGALRSTWPSILAVVTFIVTSIAVGSVLSEFTPVLDGGFYGTDPYLRMLRVRDLLADFSWFDAALINANAPFGLELHWTRPWDIVLFLIAWPLSLTMSADQALTWTGAIAPPLFLIATSLVTAWTAGVAFGRNVRIWAALAILVQPATVSYALSGRPDHHVFQFMIFAAAIGTMLKLIRHQDTVRSAAMLGVITVFGLWVSPEFLILLFVAAIVTGLLAINTGNAFNLAFQTFAFAVLFTATAALFLERGSMANWSHELDRLSWVHLWASVAVAAVAFSYCQVAVLLSIERIQARFMLLASVAIIIAAVLLYFVPDLILDPMRAATTEGPAWISGIAELRPLLPLDFAMLGRFIMELGIPLTGLLYGAYKVRTLSAGTDRQIWLLLTAALLLFFCLGIYQYRSAPYAQIVGAMVLADVISWLRQKVEDDRPEKPEPVRLALVTASPLICFALFGSVLMDFASEAGDGTPQPVCKVNTIAPIFTELAETGSQPVVLMSMNFTPELLYRAPVQVISLPSHRNSDGVLDAYRALHSPDAVLAERIIGERGVSHIVLCPGIKERSPFKAEDRAKGLAANLIAGIGPPWISEMPASGVGDFRLFKVGAPGQN